MRKVLLFLLVTVLATVVLNAQDEDSQSAPVPIASGTRERLAKLLPAPSGALHNFRADVPTLMRTHRYAFDYQNLEHARITLAEVAKGKGLDACGCCTDCSAKCSHTVNIRRKIEALKTIDLV